MRHSRFSPVIVTLVLALASLGATMRWLGFNGTPAMGLVFLSVAISAWWFGWRLGLASLAVQLGTYEAARVLGYFQPDSAHWLRMLITCGTGLGLISLLHRAHSMNEQLALASEKLQLAQESAEVWPWEYDPEREVFTWRDPRKPLAHERHTSAKEILESMHPDDRTHVMQQMTHTLDSESDYRVEFRTLHKGRERWVLSRGRVHESMLSPRRVIGMNVDITARKRAEDSRILEENAKLTSQLAHEINNSLEAAISATYLLASDSPESRKPEYLDILRDAHEHIRSYVRKLVDTATAHHQ